MKTILLATTSLAMMVHFAQASLVINSLNTTSTIDFNSFRGDGFAPTPTSGQLDSDTWRVTGLSDGSSTFGGTHTSGDFARGEDDNGATTGGVYAFRVGTGNYTLGVQPAGSDFTPGTFTLRIQNTTGATVNNWNLAYDLYVRNDQARSNSFTWAWSTNDSTYTQLSTFTSGQAADASPTYALAQSNSFTNVNASVANNDFFYLRWSGDDVGGSGSRDEFAIDNVAITAVPETSTALPLAALCAGGLLIRRRK